jgi:hypothetical protein
VSALDALAEEERDRRGVLLRHLGELRAFTDAAITAVAAGVEPSVRRLDAKALAAQEAAVLWGATLDALQTERSDARLRSPGKARDLQLRGVG